MSKLNLAPTKSNLLSLKRQLAFAKEGYDLLEQKRQILIFELMSRLAQGLKVEQELILRLKDAYAALREASLDCGSETLTCAALGAKLGLEGNVTRQHLMGIKISKITALIPSPRFPFGVSGTSATMYTTVIHFSELLPKLIEFAELQNAVMKLARELRKTQRRCNALSKTFIPSYQETITFISDTLEERERESLNILKLIRDRLQQRHN